MGKNLSKLPLRFRKFRRKPGPFCFSFSAEAFLIFFESTMNQYPATKQFTTWIVSSTLSIGTLSTLAIAPVQAQGINIQNLPNIPFSIERELPTMMMSPQTCTNQLTLGSTGSFNGSWSSPSTASSNVRIHTVQLPSSPGAGYMEVSLQRSNLDLAPSLRARVLSNGREAELAAAQRGKNDPAPASAIFEVAGGQTVNLIAAQHLGTQTQSYPVSYTLNWRFTPRVDCYEPNNISNQARPIPLNQVITASIIAGQTVSGLNQEARNDWYQFRLDQPATVDFSLLQVPRDQAFRLGLFEVIPQGSTRSIPLGNTGGSAGQTFNTDSVQLPAGTYRLQMNAWLYGDLRVTNDMPIQDRFQTPYQLRINTR
ncbi:hypothetical protein FLX56_18225 [Synechococcus moorigangaii CMS01]|nr:hypothetical protein [Synechococcus moorigangaii CMS01]